jgi:hypothetical protein
MIRRIGRVIKTLTAQVGQFLVGSKCPVSRGIFMQEQGPYIDLAARGVFPLNGPSIALAEMRNTYSVSIGLPFGR